MGASQGEHEHGREQFGSGVVGVSLPRPSVSDSIVADVSLLAGVSGATCVDSSQFDGPVADEISGAKIPNRGARTPMSGFTTDGGVMGHPKSGTSSLQRANGVNGHHASSSMQEEVVNESMARDA